MVAAVATTIMGIIVDMAIPSDARGVRMSAAQYLLRATVSLLGLAAIVWGGWLFPVFWNQAALARVASEVVQAHTFKSQSLLDEVGNAEPAQRSSLCNPTTLHDLVILRLSILNSAIAAASLTQEEAAYTSLYDLTKKALACSPSDPFVWLALFWLDARRHGLQPDNERYLRLSYALGPYEGWIALWRNRLAVAVYAQLPADLADDAIGEFVKLVDTGRLYPETVAIFASAAPSVQNRMVENLKEAHLIPRQIFARALYDKGLDVRIPETAIPGLRSWER